MTGTFVVATTVLAVNPSTTGLFELDTSTTVPPCPVTTPPTTICGNANTADNPAGGADDWANVYKSFTGLGTATADHAFARTFITDPVSSAENSYYTGGGSKDVNDIPQWQFATTNDPVPDKDDIVNLFAAAYTHPGSGHTILYFGMDRYDNNGDSETGFWFFENPVSLDGNGHFTGVHTGTAAAPGDVLVLADWGGSNPVGDITVYQWIGGKNPLIQVADNTAGDCALSGASLNFCAVVNRTADTPQWPFLDKGGSAAIRPLELFEAGIDLNAVFGADRCFASFLGATRSSHSTTAQLKDFALGNFEQCGASLSTQVSNDEIFVGDTVTDDATVHVNGGANPPAPTGTVSFKVDGVAFDTQPLSTAVKDVNDYTVTSKAYTATTTGQHCFSASWPGDGNYKPVSPATVFADDGTNECFNVVKRPSSTDTLSDPTGGDVTPGSSVTDTATVSGSGGGPTPTGTVDFYLCQPATVTANGGDCSAGGAKVGATKSLVGGVATSDPSTNTTTVGKYCWRAEYSGDNVYLSSKHTDSTNECFTTTRVPSTTVTTSSPNGVIAVGDSVTDTATVSGDQGTPTGTIDFFLCQPNEVTAGGCEGTAGTKVGATKTLVAGTVTSDASTDTDTVGKYCWRAEYSGDGVYFSSTHTDSTNECFTVKDSTDATSAQNWLPNDSGTITSTGGTALNGTLSFTLYSGTTCTGTILRAAQTFTLTDAASPATRTTTNTTTKVLSTQSVSWLVAFDSTDPLVGSSSHCESTSLTITN
jgi:hypothetical protein